MSKSCPLAISSTGTPNRTALPNLPAWAVQGFTWAPTVLPRADGYVLFYTVREPHAGAPGHLPRPFVRSWRPLRRCERRPPIYQLPLGGSIDASPFVDADGTAYLVWKADSNAISQPSSLWIQPLAGDGLELTGVPTRLLGYDAAWENPLIEAPSVVHNGATYDPFYSANWWNTNRYSIGYATRHPTCSGHIPKQQRRHRGSRRTARSAGPGGQEWLTDDSGQLRMAYHGWQPNRVGYPDGARSLRLATVSMAGSSPVAS